MLKYVIMTLFFVFAGTPPFVVPSGHLVSLNSAVGQTFPGRVLTEVSHNSWIVKGRVFVAVSHNSGT